MVPLYIAAALLTLACIVLIVMLMGSKRKETHAMASAESAEKKLCELESRLRDTEAEYARISSEKNERINTLTGELARAQVTADNLMKQADRDKQELEKLQASFRHEFRNLANQILEEKSEHFKRTNKEELDKFLKPFRDNISEFKERVEKIYSEENLERGALKNEIKNLQDLNNRITEETTNLTNALRGNSKVQGDWGEMILQTILERSHFVNGIHYTIQQNLKDEHGNNLRPDVILNLPDNKQIIIDSKVSLTAYVNYTSCEDASQSERHIKDHLTSFRRHVDELGSKRYQELVDSPDFVIMFVPNEQAFMCALQNDTSIWDDAYRKKVIISSPTNLFALLKIVDDIWKRDNQSRNALKIAEEGAKLYDKFVGFVENLEAIGKNITSARASYEKAIGQLSEGPGNLVRRTEILRELGVKTSKSLPPKYSSDSTADGTEESQP